MAKSVDDAVENAAAAYFIEREIPPLQATLSMYREAFSHLATRWPEAGVAALQRQVEDIVPESSLFNIWTRLVFNAGKPAERAATTEFLQRVRDALSRIIEQPGDSEDLKLVAEIGPSAETIARRYIELKKKIA